MNKQSRQGREAKVVRLTFVPQDALSVGSLFRRGAQFCGI
jgi:hypothetical protein